MPTSNAATDAPDVNTAPTVAAAQPEVDLSSSQQKNANESVMPPRRFWQLSILQRVTISQILYILLFAAAAVLIFVVNHNQQSAQQAVDVNGIYRVHAAAASLGAGLVAVDGEMAQARERSDYFKNAAQDAAKMQDLLSSLQQEIAKLPDSPVKAELSSAFNQELQPAAAQYLTLTQAALAKQQLPAGLKLLQLTSAITAGVNHIEQLAVHGIYRAATGASQLLSYIPIAMGIGLALMVLCFLFTMASLRRSLRQNASRVLRALKRIEQGDLSVRINPKSGDEIGRIAAFTDSFVESSDKTLSLIRDDIEKLHDMVGSNRNALDTANGVILDQRNKAQYVANATAEMEDAVEQVAEFAKSTLKEVKGAEDASETCRRTMSDNITTTHTLSDRLRASSEAINRIHEMGDKIKSIVTTIEDIADQTNLLALNATIEAARAGDAGRGFAIVAEEIRNLASKTAVSTKEVRSTISELDEAVINSVNVMASCEGEMVNSLAQSSRANSSIEEIMGIIATISDMSEQIVSACEKQAASAGEINQSIANISKLAEDNYEHMSGIHSSMSELDELATSQAEVIAAFTLTKKK